MDKIRREINPEYSPSMNMILILDVLRKYTDINNPIKTQGEIQKKIKEEYGVSIGRTALRSNLHYLKSVLEKTDFGFELECEFDKTRINKHGEEEEIWKNWYLSRDIEESELCMLIDGLLFSKYIPYSECNALVEKLEKQSSVHFKRDHRLSKNKPENKEIFWNIEVIRTAIAKNKMIAFKGLVYGTDMDGKPQIVLNENGLHHIYVVSPYEIVITNGRYYLLCAHNIGDDLFCYRLDYIKNIEFVKIDENGPDNDKNYRTRRPLNGFKGYENGLDLARYMREHIYMFGGKSVDVEFIARKKPYPNIAGQIRDWFNEVHFMNEDKDTVRALVTVNERAMLYWALQFGPSVEVIKPVELREQIAKEVADMYKRYCGEGSLDYE